MEKEENPNELTELRQAGKRNKPRHSHEQVRGQSKEAEQRHTGKQNKHQTNHEELGNARKLTEL